MNTATLELELLDDVVISSRAASFGGHESLDYLPGATLLGWAASRLYAELEAQDLAYLTFHSGHMRFGNGLPLDAFGAMGCPTPQCWSHTKGEAPDQIIIGDVSCTDSQSRFFMPGRFNNQLVTSSDARHRTLREGYVVPATGEWLHPRRTLRMKTAIHPQRGRAAQGQLFGYQSLAAGQRFRAVLSADDEIPQAVFSTIRDAFDAAILHIGRSRSAQYGRVRCTVREAAPNPAAAMPGGDTLTLWLLADLAALDHNGQPTLTPNLRALCSALPEVELDLQHSYFGSRRYSPYNAFRRAPEMEHHVIEQGSVLRYPVMLNSAQLALLNAGLGLYREAGLGAVAVNPTLLTQAKPDWPEPRVVIVSLAPEEPTAPLITWLKARQEAVPQQDDGTQNQGLASELSRLYLSARRYAGAPEHVLIGPSASQWGSVVQAVRGLRNRSPDDLMERMFDERDGICRSKGKDGWGGPTGLDAKIATFACWLERQLRDPETDEPLPLSVALNRLDTLARLAKDYIRKELRS